VGDGDNAGPPRPRLALRVGITGHRADALDDMAETAAMDIARALAVLRSAVLRLADAEKALFADEPPLLRCISALASGSDQLGARAALELDYRLSAPLPFVRNDYFQDFTNADEEAAFDYLIARCDAVFELDGSRRDEPEAYEVAGLTVLRQSDVLLAVWDGERGRGRGGTAEIIRAAVEAVIPVIWVKPGESGSRLVDWTNYDRIIHGEIGHSGAPLADAELLAKLVDDLLAPPATPSKHRRKAIRRRHHAPPVAEPRSRHRLKVFLDQQERRTPPLIAYKLLRSTARAIDWRIDKRSWAERAEEHWQPYERTLADRGVATPTPADSRLFRAFAWSDGLATYYGLRYRNTAIRNFMLSAVAVFFALFGLFDAVHDLKPWFVAAELLVIAWIVVGTVLALRAYWHERWTDYRGLGERLRLMRVLGLVGSSEIERNDPRREPPRRWASWYYAAIAREIDLPNHRVDKSYLTATLDMLRACEIEGQLSYHRRNFAEAHRLTFVLECIGLGTLGFTFLIGFWYLYRRWGLGIEQLPTLTMWVTFIAGLFPAIGAACLGIREQSELGRRRNLSVAMYDRLRRLRVQAWRARRSPSLPEVSTIVEDTASAMTAEVGDWSFLFRTRPISLPG
jgi:hypothetical protein